VVTTPFLLPYLTVLAAWLRGAPSVLIVYDVYPEVLVLTGLAREKSISVRIVRRLNALLYRALDAVVVIGRDMEKHLTQYRGVTADKLHYIPNWATLEVRERSASPNSPFRAGREGQFLIGLSGNLGFTHDPDTVFEAARRLGDTPRVQFMLSGWGIGWQRLKALQDAAQLPNVTIVERVPDAQLDDFLASAEAWIIPYRKTMCGVSVPSRFYNLLAIGRPIIALSEPDAEHALILRENDVGWVVPPEQPDELAAMIRKAAADPEEARGKGRRAVAIVGERFTRETSGRAYRTLAAQLRAKALRLEPRP